MNRNDFRNPLIQSGIILLVAFILISVVVSSPANGFFSGILAILVAILKSVLFVFGLTIALVCSIAILVGIYLLTVYFYSADNARNFFSHLKDRLNVFYCRARNYCDRKQVGGKKEESLQDNHFAADSQVSAQSSEIHSQLLEKRINNLELQTEQIKSSMDSATNLMFSLQTNLEELKNNSPSAETQPEQGYESAIKNIEEKIELHSATLNTISEKFIAIEQKITTDLNTVTKEMADLREKATVPSMVSGILSYIDSPADREKMTKKAEEAVSRGMTYSQSDEFFKKSLPAKIYKILSAHPRLTKDFIRSVKKKFA